MDFVSFIIACFIIIFLVPYTIKQLIQAKRKKFVYGLVSIMIFSLLYYLSLPNYMCIHEMSPVSRTKANAHTLQTMVDTYYENNNKKYPKNIDELKKEALSAKVPYPYWKELKNPFTYNTGKGEAYDDFNRVLINEKISLPELRKVGLVYYSPIFNKKGKVIKYYIYASGKDGFLIKEYENKFFTLTNN